MKAKKTEKLGFAVEVSRIPGVAVEQIKNLIQTREAVKSLVIALGANVNFDNQDRQAIKDVADTDGLPVLLSNLESLIAHAKTLPGWEGIEP